jgi:hypothetical protein
MRDRTALLIDAGCASFARQHCDAVLSCLTKCARINHVTNAGYASFMRAHFDAPLSCFTMRAGWKNFVSSPTYISLKCADF